MEKKKRIEKNNSVIQNRKEIGIDECERGLKETHPHCVVQLTPNTVLEISSKEGREWEFDCKHAETS